MFISPPHLKINFMKFDNNPLKGVSLDKKGKHLVDSDGNVLLTRQGTDWSENDQFGYDLLMKSMDYDYQSALLNYQNEYNSPSEQAKRMREAGINPDLVGTQNMPSASSSASAPSTQLNEGAETHRKFAMAQQFIQLVPQAFKMYSDIVGLSQSRQLGDIQILKGIQQIGDSEVSRQFTLEDLKSGVSMPQANLSHIKNKKLRSRVDDYIFSLVSDSSNRDYAKGLVYDKKRNSEQVRKGYLDLLSEFGYDIDDDTFVSVLREFNQSIFGAQKEKSKYEKDYYSHISGVEDAKLRTTRTGKEIKEAENDIMADLLAKANRKIDSNDRKEQIVGAIMYMVLTLMQNSSFSRSSGPKGATTSFGF